MATEPEARSLSSSMACDRMVEDILKGIAKGELKEGQKIASEAKLKERYKISFNSIKSGLNQLVESGVLRRRRGSGTYVASVEAATPRTLVQRDTFAIVRSWEYWRYHPFFSEQLNGIIAGLSRFGWKSIDLIKEIRGSIPCDRDTSFLHPQPQTLLNQLKQHPEVAGIICLQCDISIDEALTDAGYTLVSTDIASPGIAISYDWDAENRRLFQIALEKGARTIGVVSSMDEGYLQEQLRTATRAIGLTKNKVQLHHLSFEDATQQTQLIAESFRVTREAFQTPPVFDGLVIPGDYEVQGAIDALMQTPGDYWRSMPIVAQINKETRLPAQIPMTALVADGYAYGQILTDHLHRQATTSQQPPKRTILHCDQVEWE